MLSGKINLNLSRIFAALTALTCTVGCSTLFEAAVLLVPVPDGAKQKQVKLRGEMLALDGSGLAGCVLSLNNGKPLSDEMGTSEIESTAPLNHSFKYFPYYDGVEKKKLSIWCQGTLAYQKSFNLNNQNEISIGSIQLPWIANEINLKGKVQNWNAYNYCYWSATLDDNIDTRMSGLIKDHSEINQPLRVTYPETSLVNDIVIGVFCNTYGYKSYKKKLKPVSYQELDTGGIVFEKEKWAD